MNISSWIWPSSQALAVALLLSSCGAKPGIEILSQPYPRTAGADLVFDGKSFSQGTKAVLNKENLLHQAHKDPVAVIQQLDRRLQEGEHLALRLAAAEVAMNQAILEIESGSSEVFGYLLTAIALSEGGLASHKLVQHSDLLAIYNEANAELAELLHRRGTGTQRVEAQGPLKNYQLRWSGGNDVTTRAGFYDTLTAASRIKVQGFDNVNVRPGVGGSLVGYRASTPERRTKDPFMPHSGYATTLTSLVRWGSDGSAELVLYDLLEEETTTIAGKRYPLGADFTAAIATVANASPPKKTGLLGMIRPSTEANMEGLFTLGPYREDRIPLILVHGLLSTPMTWLGLVNACYADPVIRENYQVLVFFYPTGYSIPTNAATLREKLKEYQERYDPQRSNPKMRKMVMVGHSMGCNLTTFQIHEGGDDLRKIFFTSPLGEVGLDPAAEARQRRNIYFKANPDIDRVIFICGPHRGSPLSNSWIGRFGARLIRLPFHVVDQMSGNELDSVTLLGQSVFDETISSINNLKPNSPILLSILEQPTPYHPKIHSIIGDRGKASGVGSSDGVVPYWSSHLDQVESEQFIPASHTHATNNPENVQMVRAILYEHIGKKLPAASRPATASAAR